MHVSPTDPCPGLVKTWAACLMGEEAAKQDMYEPFIAAGRTIRRSSAALQATENMLSEFYSHHVRRPKSSSGTIWVHKCMKTLLKTGKIHPYSTYGWKFKRGWDTSDSKIIVKDAAYLEGKNIIFLSPFWQKVKTVMTLMRQKTSRNESWLLQIVCKADQGRPYALLE